MHPRLMIIYLQLINFVNIESGLHTRKLTIDFTGQKHQICIIRGINGRGKTSLLSYMTPFAGIGNLDPRDSTPLIIRDQKGYKKINFKDEINNLYEIEHHYIPEKNKWTIKSYFKYNGKELNENGNVMSFKRLVADFLGLEMDYLKLIRMGDNISNLIKSKSTERKVFMGKLLEDVDEYLRQHKKFSIWQRETKSVMNHIIDELGKTEIESIPEAKEKIKDAEKNLAKIIREIKGIEAERTRILYDMEETGYCTELEEKLQDLKDFLKESRKILSTIDLSKTTADSIRSRIQEKEKHSISNKTTLESKRKQRRDLLDSVDGDLTLLHSLENEMEKERKDLDMESLQTHIIDLRKKVSETHREIFNQQQFQCSPDEFNDFVIWLKNIQLLLNNTYELGKAPIKEVLKGMKKKEDIPLTITASLVALESKQNSEKLAIIDRLVDKYTVNYHCNDKSCPYMSLHKELMEIKDAKIKDDIKYTAEFYEFMRMAYENLSKIFDMIRDKKRCIIKLPKDIQDIFETDRLFDAVGKGELIYDEKRIELYLSYFAEYQTHQRYTNELKEAEAELEHMKKLSRMDFLTKQVNIINDRIKGITVKVDGLEEEIESLEEFVASDDKELVYLEKVLHSLEDYESSVEGFNIINNKIAAYYAGKESLVGYERQLITLNHQKDQIEKELFTKRSNLQRYKELTKQLDEVQEEYEDLDDILFSVSNRSGIPLIHIDTYLEDTKEIANELLDIIYEGSLYLDDFDISENDFKIPYIKNGIKVADVSSASQGEQSFLNMAISSALRCQALEFYNIALFDEVDSMFDDTNRQRFIPLLDRQLELGNVKQGFLITHNLMFKNYPVDLIDLDNPKNSTVSVMVS